MTMGVGTIIEGKDMPAFFAGHSRTLLAHAACIAIKDTENRVSSKGTATFVVHGDQRFIFTAEHVVSALEQADEGQRALLLPTMDSVGEFVVEHALFPNEIAFPLNVIWRDAALDAAVLDASFVQAARVIPAQTSGSAFDEASLGAAETTRRRTSTPIRPRASPSSTIAGTSSTLSFQVVSRD
jgi:hypothetical protein